MSTHDQDEALRGEITATLLAAADVQDHELTDKDRRELAAAVGALVAVFARHRHPAVWTTQTVRDVSTAVLTGLWGAGHGGVDRPAVTGALAAAGIEPGAIR